MSFKFTIPAGLNPGLCCQENLRYDGTRCVLAVKGIENGLTYLVATNGRILSVVPIDSPGPDQPTLLPAQAVMTGPGKRGLDEDFEEEFTPQEAVVEISENGEEISAAIGVKPDHATVWPASKKEGRFPNARFVLPMESIDGYSNLTINVNLLATLAKAISDGGILTLLIPKADDKGNVGSTLIAVGQNDESQLIGIGLIVPMESKNNDQRREYVKKHAAQLPNESITFPIKPKETHEQPTDAGRGDAGTDIAQASQAGR